MVFWLLGITNEDQKLIFKISDLAPQSANSIWFPTVQGIVHEIKLFST